MNDNYGGVISTAASFSTHGTAGLYVDSPKVICDALGRNGAPCGQAARVNAARYLYALETDDDGAERHVLRQSHYDIACPACGTRTQVVHHADA